MQVSIAVGISLPTKIVEKIDAERGDVSRSRYVLKMIKKFYEAEQLQEFHVQNEKEQQQIESRGQPRDQSAAALSNRIGGTLRID
jgi:metal-responsive CopG/Arc/MetJ family transcriptional regulator